jgi:hypothetical protein
VTADVHLLADETSTSVAAVCRALELPRSSAYARRNRPLSCDRGRDGPSSFDSGRPPPRSERPGLPLGSCREQAELAGACDVVDLAARERAARHARKAGFRRILYDREPSAGLDLNSPEAPSWRAPESTTPIQRYSGTRGRARRI